MRSKKKKIRSKKKKIMISKKIMRSKKNKSIGGSGGLLFKQKNELEGDKLCQRLSGNEFLKKCKIILIVGHGALLDEKLEIGKNKIIVALNKKKRWIDPYKTGPESMFKLGLLREEISKILKTTPAQYDSEKLLNELKEKLNKIMKVKIDEIENEGEDSIYFNKLQKITGERTAKKAAEVATEKDEEEANRQVILARPMTLVNRGLVNEFGIIINFTVYENPNDMEILLVGAEGQIAKKKTEDQIYADTNYILGFTKDGESEAIQTIEDTKIKLSSLLEALNNGEEEEKIIIPLICLEEKSSGRVKVVGEGVTSIFEDNPVTPREIYNGRERLQPGQAQMQKGPKTSPFQMTPGKFIGEGEQTQAMGASNNLFSKEEVLPTQEQEQEQQPLTLLELFDSSSPPPSPVPRGAWEQTKALLKPREALLHKGLSSPPLWKKVAERKASNSASKLGLTRSRSEGSLTTEMPSSGSGSESSLKRSRSSSINAEINRDAMLTRRPKGASVRPPGLTLP